MNSLDAILFPDTNIFRDSLYPVFLICKPIHYLQLIEPGPDTGKNETDIFMEQGLCQGHTPIPLGKDRERFLHLVKDIASRKDDYAAQLSSLTLAALSAPKSQKQGEARHEIVSSLLRGYDVATAETDEAELECWQDRLVLAIAEILDREEEELLDELQSLDERELEMFRSLQGEEGADSDDPFAELEQIKARLEGPRPLEIRKRFKAWLRLMRRGVVPPDGVWLATSRDGADQILTAFEKRHTAIAPPVLRLTLPARIAASDAQVAERLSLFHRAAGDVRAACAGDLDRLSRSEFPFPATLESLLPSTTQWPERWEILVEDHFPASSHGRAELSFHVLPDQPIAELLGLTTATTKSAPARHGLLAIYSGR